MNIFNFSRESDRGADVRSRISHTRGIRISRIEYLFLYRSKIRSQLHLQCVGRQIVVVYELKV